MNHKQKRKLAKKMMTDRERAENVSPFICQAWQRRAEAKRIKQQKQKENSQTKKKLQVFAS